jgi:hypothetical protein
MKSFFVSSPEEFIIELLPKQRKSKLRANEEGINGN